MTTTFRRMRSEDEYLALPETKEKIEFFDGCLVEQPSPSYRHRNIAPRLWLALRPAAQAAGLRVYLDVGLRLRSGRIAIPDLVLRPMVENPRHWLAEVASVRLICEITSTNKATDTVRKKRYYAEAGIPWYLIVEPDEPILTLYRLSGRRYVEEATAKPGQTLRLTDPVVADLDPAALATDD